MAGLRPPQGDIGIARVRVGAIVALLGFGFMSYAGLPQYGIQLTAGSELVTEWVPIEGEGIVDETRWSALPDARTTFEVTVPDEEGGEVQTRVYGLDGAAIEESTLTSETRAMFEEFREHIEHWVELDERFIAPTASLTIEPWIYATDADGNLLQDVVQIKRASVNLVWSATEVDENGEVTVLTNKQGEPEQSRLQQVDYLNRDSHHDRLEDNASAPRQASE